MVVDKGSDGLVVVVEAMNGRDKEMVVVVVVVVVIVQSPEHPALGSRTFKLT